MACLEEAGTASARAQEKTAQVGYVYLAESIWATMIYIIWPGRNGPKGISSTNHALIGATPESSFGLENDTPRSTGSDPPPPCRLGSYSTHLATKTAVSS